MLILSRKENESIVINQDIKIEIISIDEGKVKIGISAPKDVTIFREEVLEKVKLSNADAVAKEDVLSLLNQKINQKQK